MRNRTWIGPIAGDEGVTHSRLYEVAQLRLIS